MYRLQRFISDMQTLVSGARKTVSEWDGGIFTRAGLTSQYIPVAVWRARRDTGASKGSQMGLQETGNHRRSQASRQHLGKSTQPDKLASNSHAHTHTQTMPALAHFQTLSKTKRGRENYYYYHYYQFSEASVIGVYLCKPPPQHYSPFSGW